MPSIRELFQAARRVGTVLLGKQMAGRGVTCFADDVFLVSYPRSGNTWTRFLIGNLLYPDEPSTFLNIESRIPEIYFNQDWKLRRLPRPRLLKSHEAFEPRYPRVIYVVRDPRDVAVSSYHHNIKTRSLPEGCPLEEYVSRFVGPQWEAGGSWGDNAMSWLALRQNRPNFLLLRYEDLRSDPESELCRMADFLKAAGFRNVDAAPERIARAVELGSAERMRRLEKVQSRHWVTTKWTRQDKPFIRTATSGGWRSVLSSASVAQIESAWGPLMQRLGYELSVCTVSSAALEFQSEALQLPEVSPKH